MRRRRYEKFTAGPRVHLSQNPFPVCPECLWEARTPVGLASRQSLSNWRNGPHYLKPLPLDLSPRSERDVQYSLHNLVRVRNEACAVSEGVDQHCKRADLAIVPDTVSRKRAYSAQSAGLGP